MPHHEFYQLQEKRSSEELPVAGDHEQNKKTVRSSYRVVMSVFLHFHYDVYCFLRFYDSLLFRLLFIFVNVHEYIFTEWFSD